MFVCYYFRKEIGMEYTEVLKRVNSNLGCQSALGEELKKAQTRQAEIEEEISNLQDSLNGSLSEIADLKNCLKEATVKEFMQHVHKIAPIYGKLDEKTVYSLGVIFMEKSFNVTDVEKSNLEEMENYGGNFVKAVVEKAYDDYMAMGEEILDQTGLKDLTAIFNNYKNKESAVTKSIESVYAKRRKQSLEKEIASREQEYKEKKVEIEDIEKQLLLCKEFKSELLQRVFSRKQRLMEKHDKLVAECGKIMKKLVELNEENNNKEFLKEKAQQRAKEQIEILVALFKWLDDLKSDKSQIEAYEQDVIKVLEARINALEVELADTEISVDEFKGSLNLNKKINNGIVENALNNKKFIEDFNAIDSQNLPTGCDKAYKFIESKYRAKISKSINDMAL